MASTTLCLSTDYMFTIKCSEDGNFSDGGLQRFGRIELNPAACVLNYGQVIVSLLFINPVYFSPHLSISWPAAKFGTI